MDVLSAMGVFVRVVDLKSFSLAASELGISSSSVSKQIFASGAACWSSPSAAYNPSPECD